MRKKRKSKFRNAVVGRDGRCMNRYCLSLDTHKLDRLEAHHIIERSQGGPNTPENGITLCPLCLGFAKSGDDYHKKGMVTARQFMILLLEDREDDERFCWAWALAELKKKEGEEK